MGEKRRPAAVVRGRVMTFAVMMLVLLGVEIAVGVQTARGAVSNVQVQQIEVREDEQFRGVVATFNDDQYLADYDRFTATIFWGDGTSSPGSVACRGTCAYGAPSEFEVRGEHMWADPGDYVVRVVVTKESPFGQSSGEGQAGARVLAQPPPPQPPPPPPTPPPPRPPPPTSSPPPSRFGAAIGPPVPEGRPFAATATKVFTGPVAFVPPASGLTAVIDWGDGKKSLGSVGSDGSIIGSHSFAMAGLHQVITTVVGQRGTSVASATASVRPGGLKSRPGCTDKISFAKLGAVGACFRKTSEGTWVVEGERVRVNGLDIQPVGAGTEIRFDEKSARLVTTGTVIVRAGPITLYRGSLSLDANVGIPGNFKVAANAAVAGFAIKGSLAGRFERLKSEEGSVYKRPVFDYGVTLDVHLELPKDFGGLTGDAALRLTNKDGLVLDGLRLQANSIYLGALHIERLFVDYRRIGNEWRGGAKLSLPSGVGLNASPPPPEQGVTFRDGELVSIGATLGFPNPGIVIASGVFLNSIGFQVGTSPTRFLGNAQFSTGKAGGKTLARIDGSMFIAFARPDQPFTAPVGVPAKPRTFRSTAFHVAGTVTLVDRFNLGGAYLLYVDPGYAELAGDFNYELLSGLVRARARVALAINTVKGQFNGEVGAEVCAAKVACVGGDLLVSNVGIAACARTFLVDVGGGIYWRGGGYFMFRSCDVGRVRVAVSPARAAQTGGGGQRFTLPNGLDKAVIGVQGRDDAPLVTLVSPSGQRFTVPAGEDWINRRDLVAFRAGEAKETYFALPSPAAGTWTVEPAQGSTAVTGVRFAETLPEPQVRARVSGRGQARTVTYQVRQIDGQRVTLFEKGRDAMVRIGEARGAKGRLAFTPADGSAGRRQIVAEVESFGAPRATVLAGTYAAPGPVKPARVRSLKAIARGSRVCATWNRAANATQYAATFALSDGRKELVLTGRRSACVSRVVGRVSGSVEVRGVTARGTRGTAAKTKLKAKKTRRSGRTPVSRSA